MADSVRIQIIRDDVVVDDSSAVLGSMQDGTKVLDAMVAAFADQYGIHKVPGETEEDDPVPVSLYRNFSFRIREFATTIVKAYVSKTAANQAKVAADAQFDDALSAVTIIEN